jgi:undecaprenyl-diphosphatase
MTTTPVEAAGAFRTALQAIRGRVGAGDRAIFQAVTGRHRARLDGPMAKVSQAADRGRVWLAVSVVLAAIGGCRGRRAAARGLTVLAMTSGIVNLGAKSVLRRERPAVEPDAGKPALRPVPASFSFPSGHTASAFAYASAAGLESRSLIAPLGALALAIGVSRVYVGAHYPTDVAAGAVIGIGIALASTAVVPAGCPRTTSA